MSEGIKTGEISKPDETLNDGRTAKTPKFSIVKDGSDLDGNGRDGTFDWIEGNAILIIAKDGNANVKT